MTSPKNVTQNTDTVLVQYTLLFPYNTFVLFVSIAVNSDETVDVTYIDFGNSETLPFADIRKLPDMFLRLPKQVRNLVIYSTHSLDSDWSVTSALIGQCLEAMITWVLFLSSGVTYLSRGY